MDYDFECLYEYDIERFVTFRREEREDNPGWAYDIWTRFGRLELRDISVDGLILGEREFECRVFDMIFIMSYEAPDLLSYAYKSLYYKDNPYKRTPSDLDEEIDLNKMYDLDVPIDINKFYKKDEIKDFSLHARMGNIMPLSHDPITFENRYTRTVHRYALRTGLPFDLDQVRALRVTLRNNFFNLCNYHTHSTIRYYRNPRPIYLEFAKNQKLIMKFFLKLIEKYDFQEFLYELTAMHEDHLEELFRCATVVKTKDVERNVMLTRIKLMYDIELNPGPVTSADVKRLLESARVRLLKARLTKKDLETNYEILVRRNGAKDLISEIKELINWYNSYISILEQYPDVTRFESAEGVIINASDEPSPAVGRVGDEPIEKSDTVLPVTTEGENVVDQNDEVHDVIIDADISDFPVELPKQTDRYIRFRTYNYNASQPAGPLFALSLPFDIVRNQYNSPNMLNFQIHDFVRTNMEIVVQTVATKFVRYGIRIAWFPHLLEHDDVESYINPYTISQMPGFFLNSATAQRGSLKINFKSFLNQVPIPASSLCNSLYFGTLVGYLYNQLSSPPGELADITLDIYASFNNAKFYVQRYRTDPVSPEPCAVFEGPIGVAVSIAQRTVALTKSLIGPVEKGLGIARDVSNIFGLDRPTKPESVDAIYVKANQPMCLGEGIAREEILRLNPVATVPHINSPEYFQNYDKLKCIEGYIGTFSINSTMLTGAKIFECLVSPSILNPITLGANIIGNEGVKSWAPVDHVAEDFSFYSGDIKFRFQFIVNGFDVFAIRCVYNPNQNSTGFCDIQNLDNKVIELGPSLDKMVDFVMECPYKVNVPLLPVNRLLNNQINMGCLSIFVERPIKMNDPTNIEVNVYKYGSSNLQFSVPAPLQTVALSETTIERTVRVSIEVLSETQSVNSIRLHQGQAFNLMNWLVRLNVPLNETVTASTGILLDENTSEDLWFYDYDTKHLVRAFPRPNYTNGLSSEGQDFTFSGPFNIQLTAATGFAQTMRASYTNANFTQGTNVSPMSTGRHNTILAPPVGEELYYCVYMRQGGCTMFIGARPGFPQYRGTNVWSLLELGLDQDSSQAPNLPAGWGTSFPTETDLNMFVNTTTLLTPQPAVTFESEAGRVYSQELKHGESQESKSPQRVTANLISGEMFSLNSVLKRKEFYMERDIVVANQVSRFRVLRVPVTVSTPENRVTSSDMERNTKILKYSDCFRFFKGSMRFRIVVEGLDFNDMYSSLMIYHDPDAEPILSATNQLIQQVDNSVYNYATMITTPNQNTIYDIEVPFYTTFHKLLNSSFRNPTRPLVTRATSLGNLHFIYTGKAKTFRIIIYRCLGDDSSFYTFVGFPERRIITEPARPQPLLVQNRPATFTLPNPLDAVSADDPNMLKTLLMIGGVEQNPGPVFSVLSDATEKAFRMASEKISETSANIDELIKTISSFIEQLTSGKSITTKVTSVCLSLLSAILNQSVSSYSLAIAQVLVNLEIISFKFLWKIKDAIFHYFHAVAEDGGCLVDLISTIVTGIAANFAVKLPSNCNFITKACSKLAWMATLQGRMAQLFNVILSCIKTVLSYAWYGENPESLAAEVIEKYKDAAIKWFAAVQDLVDPLNYKKVIADPTAIDRAQKLHDWGTQLNMVFLGNKKVAKVMGPILRTQFVMALNQLVKLKKSMSNKSQLDEAKYNPFCVYMYGPAGTGKTNIMDKLLVDLLEYRGYRRVGNNVYTFTWHTEFHNGFSQEPALILDEFLDSNVTETSNKQVELFKNLKSSQKVVANMPDLEDKSMAMDPKIIGVISNQKNPTHKDYFTQEPFCRRRDLCIETRLHPKVIPCGCLKDKFNIACVDCRTKSAEALDGSFTQYRIFPTFGNDDGPKSWFTYDVLIRSAREAFKKYDEAEIVTVENKNIQFNNGFAGSSRMKVTYEEIIDKIDKNMLGIEEIMKGNPFEVAPDSEFEAPSKPLITVNPLKVFDDGHESLDSYYIHDHDEPIVDPTAFEWLFCPNHDGFHDSETYSMYTTAPGFKNRFIKYVYYVLVILASLGFTTGVQYAPESILDAIGNKVRKFVHGGLEKIPINCSDLITETIKTNPLPDDRIPRCFHDIIDNDTNYHGRSWLYQIGDDSYLMIPMDRSCNGTIEKVIEINGEYKLAEVYDVACDSCIINEERYKFLCARWVDNNFDTIKKHKFLPPYYKDSATYKTANFANRIKMRLIELKDREQSKKSFGVQMAIAVVTVLLYISGLFLLYWGSMKLLNKMTNKTWYRAAEDPDDPDRVNLEELGTETPVMITRAMEDTAEVRPPALEQSKDSGDLHTKTRGRNKAKKSSKLRITKFESKDNYLESIYKKIGNNTFFITARYQEGDVMKEYQYRVFAIGGHNYIINVHVWNRLSTIEEFEISGIEDDKVTVVKVANVRCSLIEPTDLACINITALPMNQKIHTLFLSENEEVEETDSANMIVYGPRGTLTIREVQYNKVQHKSFSELNVDIVDGYSYNMRGQGMCMSILFSPRKQKILSFHCIGSYHRGFGQAVPKEILDKLNTDPIILTDTKLIKETNLECSYGRIIGIVQHGFLNNTSSIHPTGFEAFKPVNHPATLSFIDEEYPGQKAFENVHLKQSVIAKEFTKSNLSLVTEYLCERYKTFCEPVRKPVTGCISRDETIFGSDDEYFVPMRLNTGAGYPFCLDAGANGKYHLVTFEEGHRRKLIKLDTRLDQLINKIVEGAKIGVIHKQPFYATLKDERLPLHKINTPRIIDGSPIQLTIPLIQYTREFVASFYKNRNDLYHQVGIDIHSPDFEFLYNSINKFDNVFSLDVKSLGPTLPRTVSLYIIKIINAWYEHYGDTNGYIRQNLLLNELDTHEIYYDKLVRLSGGSPSGSVLTVVRNTLACQIFLMMAFIELTKLSIAEFDNHVVMYGYGDDWMLSVSDEIKDIYNMITIKDFLQGYNINITMSDKSSEYRQFMNLYEIDFLKNKFGTTKDFKNRVVPMRDKSLIEDIMCWYRKDLNSQDMAMTANACLQFAFYHGSEYFNKIRDAINKEFKFCNFKIQLPTYNQFKYKYENQFINK